jgi:hypothetical protein
VDQYKESLEKMKFMLVEAFPDIKIQEFHENRSQDKSRTFSGRIRNILDSLDRETRIELIIRNQLDMRLYEYALGGF